MRAIAASKIPTVSAVGHEIDVTLADLVADVRALTPSEAAERVVPAADEIVKRLHVYRDRLRSGTLRRLALASSRLETIAAHRPFRRPFDLVHDRSRRLDELAMRGTTAMRSLWRAPRRSARPAQLRSPRTSPRARMRWPGARRSRAGSARSARNPGRPPSRAGASRPGRGRAGRRRRPR